MSSSSAQTRQSAGLLLLIVIALLFPTEGINKKQPQQFDETRIASRVDCYSAYDHKPTLKLTPCTSKMVENMNRIISEAGCVDISNPGLLALPKNGACAIGSVVCDATTAAKLVQTFNANAQITVNDTGNYFRETSGVTEPYDQMRSMQYPVVQDNFFDAWRSLEVQEQRVRQLVEASGSVATIEKIGQSYEGRPISAVRLTGQNYVQGGTKVLMTFQMHAREWITGMAGVYVIEHLIAEAKANPAFLSNLQVVIVPMVNPDGFKYSETTMRLWRKNRHPIRGPAGCSGVDLNRNWPTDWNGKESTSNNPCSEIYVGESAASEPESQAVKSVIDEPGQITLHLDFHSYSEMILEPWSWTTKVHPRRAEIDALAKSMTDAIKKNSGSTYNFGGSEILYPASGVMPDYATEKGGIGLTIEMSPSQYEAGGFMLPASRIKSCVGDAFGSVIAALEFVQRKPAQHYMPSQPVYVPPQPVYQHIMPSQPVTYRAPAESVMPTQSAMQTVVPIRVPVRVPVQRVVSAPVPVQVQTPLTVRVPVSVVPR